MTKIVIHTGKYNPVIIRAIESKYRNDGFFVIAPSQESSQSGVLSAVKGREKCVVLLSVDDSIVTNNNDRITGTLKANAFSMEYPK